MGIKGTVYIFYCIKAEFVLTDDMVLFNRSQNVFLNIGIGFISQEVHFFSPFRGEEGREWGVGTPDLIETPSRLFIHLSKSNKNLYIKINIFFFFQNLS